MAITLVEAAVAHCLFEDTSQALRQAAMALPDVEEAVACQGTAVEAAKDGRFKLDGSIDEAFGLAKDHPSWLKVGANNWVTIAVTGASPVAVSVLQQWVKESYEVISGGAQAKGLQTGTRAETKAATKKTAAKKPSKRGP